MNPLIILTILALMQQAAGQDVGIRNPRNIKHKRSFVDQSLEPEFVQPETFESMPSRRSYGAPLTSNVTVKLGQNTLLTCSVRNIGSFKILWLRVKDGDVLAYDNLLITQDPRFQLIQNSVGESNLFIENAKESDAGEYVCQLNTETLKAKFSNLIVLTAPEFTDNSQSSHDALAAAISNGHGSNQYRNLLKHDSLSPKPIDIMEGDQISLECNANGVPKPEIKWYVKRFNSDKLIKYKTNTTEITVKNITRNQYDYIECQANNNVPPSISKKFKINVMFMPEIHVTPEKIFLNTLPTQVKINCSVNSFPSSDIIWVYHSKRHRHSKRRHRQEEDDEVDDVNSESFVRKNNLILNSELSYNIYLQAMNETFKQSSIIIDIVTEKDYGIYACYANNSVGGQSEKFYIFGDHGEKHRGHSSTAQNLIVDTQNNKHILNSQQESLFETKNFLNSAKNSFDMNYKTAESTASVNDRLLKEISEKVESSQNRATSKFDKSVLDSKGTSVRSTLQCFSLLLFSIFNLAIAFVI